jgi:hypothetical protein
VVVFTDQPRVVRFYRDLLAAHGHLHVRLVTSAKRNPAYLEVVGAVPVGVVAYERI